MQRSHLEPAIQFGKLIIRRAEPVLYEIPLRGAAPDTKKATHVIQPRQIFNAHIKCLFISPLHTQVTLVCELFFA